MHSFLFFCFLLPHTAAFRRINVVFFELQVGRGVTRSAAIASTMLYRVSRYTSDFGHLMRKLIQTDGPLSARNSSAATAIQTTLSLSLSLSLYTSFDLIHRTAMTRHAAAPPCHGWNFPPLFSAAAPGTFRAGGRGTSRTAVQTILITAELFTDRPHTMQCIHTLDRYAYSQPVLDRKFNETGAWGFGALTPLKFVWAVRVWSDPL